LPCKTQLEKDVAIFSFEVLACDDNNKTMERGHYDVMKFSLLKLSCDDNKNNGNGGHYDVIIFHF
jgi:hypothetical protein